MKGSGSDSGSDSELLIEAYIGIGLLVTSIHSLIITHTKMRSIASTLAIFATLLVSGVTAFAPASRSSVIGTNCASGKNVIQRESSLVLNERQWNFNEVGKSPWGLKNNAEIWNGRVAQMGFTIVLLQELITGKGVIQGIQDGDFINYAFLGLAGVSVIGLTIFLAIKGSDTYFDINDIKE